MNETTNIIPSLAYRKRKNLNSIIIGNNVVAIGDASFGYCTSLKQVTIPASVEWIGVAAFCASGLETVIFLGDPSIIEPSAFSHCKHLRQIVVPAGKKDEFVKMLPNERHLIVERSSSSTQQEPPPQVTQTSLNVGFEKVAKLRYNQQDFIFSRGKDVLISKLFSGPTKIKGNPSYQFRKKYVFIFIKSFTASVLEKMGLSQYELRAEMNYFKPKYINNYGSNRIRMFIFVCDDGEHAKFFDEVRLSKMLPNSILVESQL